MPALDIRAGVSRIARRCLNTPFRLSSSRRRVIAGAAVPALMMLLPLTAVRPVHGAQHSATSSTDAAGGSAATSVTAAVADPPPASDTPAEQVGPDQRRRLADQATTPAPDRAPLVTTYVVRSGDTLTGIAAQLGTDVASLEKINGLNNYSVISPGQKLTALRMVGWLYQVQAGDTLSGISLATGVSEAQLASVNDLTGADPVLQAGEQLVIPKDPTVTQPVARVAASVAAPSSSGGMIWPVHGPITSPFGWRLDPWTHEGSFFHDGMDISVRTGTPVAAACSGRVVIAGWDGGYGEAVQIACDNGLDTMYAHNSVVKVYVGERVNQGGLISYSGMTGNATGPHVHFGVMRNGQWVNPLPYLP